MMRKMARASDDPEGRGGRGLSDTAMARATAMANTRIYAPLTGTFASAASAALVKQQSWRGRWLGMSMSGSFSSPVGATATATTYSCTSSVATLPALTSLSLAPRGVTRTLSPTVNSFPALRLLALAMNLLSSDLPVAFTTSPRVTIQELDEVFMAVHSITPTSAGTASLPAPHPPAGLGVSPSPLG